MKQHPRLLSKITILDVILNDVEPDKINVIRVIREYTGLSLKEALDLANNTPNVVKQAISKEEVDKIMATLTQAGASVIVQ